MPVDFRDITRRPFAVATLSAAPAVNALPVTPVDAAAFVPLATPAEAAIPALTPAGNVEDTTKPQRESDVALALLNEVATALPMLLMRCSELEADLARTKDHAKAEIEAANEVTHEWQQIAATLKLQVEGLEKGLNMMKQRAEAAELKASSLRDETARSQQIAAEAECLSSLFQEKVISSFGAQSVMHPILEAFRAKTAA